MSCEITGKLSLGLGFTKVAAVVCRGSVIWKPGSSASSPDSSQLHFPQWLNSTQALNKTPHGMPISTKGKTSSHGFRQSIILRIHLGNIQSKSLLRLSLLLSWGFGLRNVRFKSSLREWTANLTAPGPAVWSFWDTASLPFLKRTTYL